MDEFTNSVSGPESPTPGPGRSPALRRVVWQTVLAALLALLAWRMPAYWKAAHPAVLQRAGQGTPTLGTLGLAAVAAGRIGPAELIEAAADRIGDPQALQLKTALAEARSRHSHPDYWGGHDPTLTAALQDLPVVAASAERAVLGAFLPEVTREALRKHLAAARSPGVRTILDTRQLTTTTEFVPVSRPGGQPLEAVTLLLGLLYEAEHLSPTLAEQLRGTAEHANATRLAGKWETVCLDVLTLATRLNWMQLAELLRLTPDLPAMTDVAQSVKAAEADLAVVYSAMILSRSPEVVARYLNQFGSRGAEDLGRALGFGQGAVQWLTRRQVPLVASRGSAPPFTATLAWKSPQVAAALKLAAMALSGLMIFLVWNELSAVQSIQSLAGPRRALRLGRGAVLGLLTLGLIVASEPFLFRPASAPDYIVRFTLPAFDNSPVPTNLDPSRKPPAMELSTILSITLFAGLQVAVYAICLLRIREIDLSRVSAQLKLRLMDNEENLFDSGLYVGIAGTAAALVLQVLGVIRADLLAAYSSNLLGIICVALVKIRHVREFKRKLILDSQPEEIVTAVNQSGA